MRFLVFTFILYFFVVICSCENSKKCEENEEWKSCISSNCAEKKCDEKDEEDCTKDCIEGCFCKSGFKRSSRGICVEKCRCGINEVELLGNSDCVRFCASLSCSSFIRPLILPDPSKFTCICKIGFGLENGKCQKCPEELK